MNQTKIENALQVAGFTIDVIDYEIDKTNWEKKMNFTELDEVVKDS